jgi:hypothetical protein
MRRIQARHPENLKTKIQLSSIVPSNTVIFSFKYLDFSNEKFQVKHRDGEYLHKLFERIKSLSSWNINDIHANRSKALRAHPIKWETTSEKDGFGCLNEQFGCLTGYELSVEKEIYGRIHGFILDNYFFIVWLDPEHKLYR